MSERLAKSLFLLSLVVVLVVAAAAVGVLVGAYRLWPHEPIRVLVSHVKTLAKAGTWQPEGLIVEPAPGASRERVTIHAPDRVAAGYRAVMGWDSETEAYRIWLFDAEGRERHAWPIDYAAIDPDGPSGGRDEPHGMAILEDGSALVTFDFGDALARIDPCGQPVWTLPGAYHHSIEPVGDGTFWTWRGEPNAHADRQVMVRFDAGGSVLEEHDLIDDFVTRSPEASLIFGVPWEFQFRDGPGDPMDPAEDIFHTNDVEPLPAGLAGAFPMFEAGDLLVSLRTLDLVAVLDPEARRVKWWSRGPWREQHDPDFDPDGRIVVFSNNRGKGRSDLIALDPATRAVERAFEKDGLSFYSAYMGKHQRLPDDTVLLVSPYEGRVIEATWEGDLLLEINNIFSNEFNAHVANAEWLTEEFFTTLPACR